MTGNDSMSEFHIPPAQSSVVFELGWAAYTRSATWSADFGDSEGIASFSNSVRINAKSVRESAKILRLFLGEAERAFKRAPPTTKKQPPHASSPDPLLEPLDQFSFIPLNGVRYTPVHIPENNSDEIRLLFFHGLRYMKDQGDCEFTIPERNLKNFELTAAVLQSHPRTRGKGLSEDDSNGPEEVT
ncbi:hypothetical protein K438DRAFT_1783063 [Mycena galopus ATCC 62051]|nr:hypothetical protein K438DRAFT_1783063 [Mycena galopus ATCC 62051]